jgi:6-phosphogluconolactonase (cycloisomerase 2 family)
VVVIGLCSFLLAALPNSAPRLVFLEAHYDGKGGIDGLDDVEGVAVSPDGKHVYVVSQTDSAIVTFQRDATSGKLTFMESLFDGGVDGIGTTVDGLLGANSVAISPDGKHVYVTSGHDNSVAAFARNDLNGQLYFVEMERNGANGVTGLGAPVSVTISADGKNVYVASYIDNAIAAFSRNVTTGRLNFLEAKFDDQAGVDGLDGAQYVAVSPDGKSVYVVGGFEHGLAVFLRSPTTGNLAFVEALFDGGLDGTGATIDGLSWPNAVAVSPDSKNVYVASSGDDAVAVFKRRPATGRLDYLEMVQEGVDGVEGLFHVVDLALSSDGLYLYTATHYGNSLAMLSRNPHSGRLSFIDAVFDDDGGVDGLTDGRCVAVSHNGISVYAGGDEDAVAVFLVSHLGFYEANPPEAAEEASSFESGRKVAR